MQVSNWKRVLATGEAGFLGPHPCERLLNGGCDVTFPLFVEVDEGFVKTIDHFRKFPAL